MTPIAPPVSAGVATVANSGDGAALADGARELAKMTISEVKRDLPNVPVVTASGKRYMAKVSGRLNQFATVTLSYVTHGAPRHHLRGRPWVDVHFSWEAVTRAINTGNPLDFDS